MKKNLMMYPFPTQSTTTPQKKDAEKKEQSEAKTLPGWINFKVFFLEITIRAKSNQPNEILSVKHTRIRREKIMNTQNY